MKKSIILLFALTLSEVYASTHNGPKIILEKNFSDPVLSQTKQKISAWATRVKRLASNNLGRVNCKEREKNKSALCRDIIFKSGDVQKKITAKFEGSNSGNNNHHTYVAFCKTGFITSSQESKILQVRPITIFTGQSHISQRCELALNHICEKIDRSEREKNHPAYGLLRGNKNQIFTTIFGIPSFLLDNGVMASQTEKPQFAEQENKLLALQCAQ